MSRKDYRAIAQALSDAAQGALSRDQDELNPAQQALFEGIVSELARVMQWDNSRFDRERFRSACGL